MVRKITATAVGGKYQYYCRQCTAYINQTPMPISCPKCGNIEVDEGFGCSGDASTSNTTTTRSRATVGFTGAVTIDKRRR